MNRPCRELKRMSRENLTHNYGIPMGALLVAWTIPLAIELPFSMVQGEHPTMLQNVIFYLAEYLIFLISYVLTAGLAYLHLNIARKKSGTVSMVFYGVKERPDRFLLAGLFESLAVLFGMIPFFIGLIPFMRTDGIGRYALLGIFSVISLGLSVFFLLNISLTLYLAVDHPELSVWTCLKNSILSMRGHKKRLLVLWLSFFGQQLLNMLSFEIGSLWIMPYQSQTLVHFYLDVTGQLPAPTQAVPGHSEYRPFNEYL